MGIGDRRFFRTAQLVQGFGRRSLIVKADVSDPDEVRHMVDETVGKLGAIEYAREGIRVNCIAPGWHGGTRLGRWIEAAGEEERRRKYEETIAGTTPMGRRGVPAELKGIVVYLASDASSFVTGQVFIPDGGICI